MRLTAVGLNHNTMKMVLPHINRLPWAIIPLMVAYQYTIHLPVTTNSPPFNCQWRKAVHHSTASDDKTVHQSIASDDKTVDHTPHSYEDVQDLEDEHHHYLQIITPEEDVTCTKDNISWNLHFNARTARITLVEDMTCTKDNTARALHCTARYGRLTPEENMTYTKDNMSWTLHFTAICAPLTPEEDAKHNTSWTAHFNVRCVQYVY